MPTYEYKCKHCGRRFEVFQSITERPVRTCPHCGKNGVKRLISAGAGIIFKGSGFYATDYKRNSGGRGAAPKKDTSKAATDTTDASSD
jgi:putative FmdB family regulatory protein